MALTYLPLLCPSFPCNTRPSSLGVAVGGESGTSWVCQEGSGEYRASIWDRRRIPRFHGDGIQGKSVSATYGIKKYCASVLPCDGPTNVPPTKSMKPLSSGGREILNSWSCRTRRSPRDYTGPGRYGVLKRGGISACSAQLAARVAAVEAVEPPPELVVEEITLVNAEGREVEPKLADGDGGPGGDGGDRGGDGGGDGGGDEEEAGPAKMSMAQKLTLIYAALVGVGGLVGFSKSGSYKSLFAGGGAAVALYFVYAQLPVNPAVASTVGLGISTVLLGIMYPRFRKSGKFMPAGLVSLVSLIMTGGYLHGIVRTAL